MNVTKSSRWPEGTTTVGGEHTILFCPYLASIWQTVGHRLLTGFVVPGTDRSGGEM